MMNKEENHQFIIELCPPSKPEDIPAYFKRIKYLLNFTNSFSISSHPIQQISGFERSYNLARYLLEQNRDLDILFHITCNDLNRVNILSRLTLLKVLKIRNILVITGENYTPIQESKEFHFTDSSELVSHIANKFNWFESIGIAGYPDKGEGDCNQQEITRLREKMLLGANKIYTQCIFTVDQLKKFSEDSIDILGSNKEVVPSIALFSHKTNLERVSRLTRVQPDDKLMEGLTQLQSAEEQKAFSKSYIINLCQQLCETQSRCRIIICAFGLFELAEEILEDLMKSKD